MCKIKRRRSFLFDYFRSLYRKILSFCSNSGDVLRCENRPGERPHSIFYPEGTSLSTSWSTRKDQRHGEAGVLGVWGGRRHVSPSRLPPTPSPRTVEDEGGAEDRRVDGERREGCCSGGGEWKSLISGACICALQTPWASSFFLEACVRARGRRRVRRDGRGVRRWGSGKSKGR